MLRAGSAQPAAPTGRAGTPAIVVFGGTALKTTDDAYWREVVTMEGTDGMQDVWEDEEVQAAMARAYGSGTIDVARMRREADGFVRNVTKGLENG